VGVQEFLVSLVLLPIFSGSAGGPGIVSTLVDAVRNFGGNRVIGELKINWKLFVLSGIGLFEVLLRHMLGGTLGNLEKCQDIVCSGRDSKYKHFTKAVKSVTTTPICSKRVSCHCSLCKEKRAVTVHVSQIVRCYVSYIKCPV
jgi:hypothetical protein